MALWGKKTETKFNEHLQDSIDDPPIDQRVELLEVEVASLKRQLKELENKLEMLERLAFRTGGQSEFRPGDQNISTPKVSENKKIYEAFDQGMSLLEIARQFNKGKGEVELILNLRNLK